MVFERAVELEILSDNPVTKVKPFQRVKDDPDEEQHSLTLDETIRYLNVANQYPLLWRTFLWIALDSGMRRGELRGLRWDSIDFSSHTVLVENNYQHGKDCRPKSGKDREVEIGPEVIDLLQQLRSCQIGESPYVFANPETGKPYDEETIGHILKEVGDAIGCPWLHCHSLRHTMATLSLAGGASLSGVSKRLGHKSTSTTSRYYVHPDNRESNEAGQKLRQLLGPALCKP